MHVGGHIWKLDTKRDKSGADCLDVHIPSPLVKLQSNVRTQRWTGGQDALYTFASALNVATLLFIELGCFNRFIEDGRLNFDSQDTDHGSKLGTAITRWAPPHPNLIVVTPKLAQKHWLSTCLLQQTGVHHQDRLLVCPSWGALKVCPHIL